jgi:hypothetical protein
MSFLNNGVEINRLEKMSLYGSTSTSTTTTTKRPRRNRKHKKSRFARHQKILHKLAEQCCSGIGCTDNPFPDLHLLCDVPLEYV